LVLQNPFRTLHQLTRILVLIGVKRRRDKLLFLSYLYLMTTYYTYPEHTPSRRDGREKAGWCRISGGRTTRRVTAECVSKLMEKSNIWILICRWVYRHASRFKHRDPYPQSSMSPKRRFSRRNDSGWTNRREALAQGLNFCLAGKRGKFPSQGLWCAFRQ